MSSDPPPVVPNYRLLRRLGRGGYGEVWLGIHNDLEQPRAIKSLRPGRFSATAVERLVREARIMARLPPHRNRVQIHDLIRTEVGAFLIMQYVEGGSLHARGILPWEKAARYVGDVADALHEVHAQGILHRDIKPANILWDQVRNEALLADFGLAGAADGPDGGTPGYIAPEILDAVSPKCDVFSLAATFYALVAGAAPFATSSLRESIADAAAGPQRLVAALDSLPRGLRDTILAGLEPDPDVRPSLDEFVHRIRGAHLQTLADQLQALSRRQGANVRLDIAVQTSPDPATPFRPATWEQGTIDEGQGSGEAIPVASARIGDLVRLEIGADADGYLTVLNLGSAGDLQVIFPNPQKRDNHIFAGQRHRLTVRVEPPAGTDRAAVIWTRAPNALTPEEWWVRIEAGQLLAAPATEATRALAFVLHEVEEQAGDAWCAKVIAVSHKAAPE